MKDKVTITVYMVDGRCFQYEVSDSTKAREHAHRIVNYGWRNAVNSIMEYYPPHQVLKVTFPMREFDLMMQKYEGKEKK